MSINRQRRWHRQPSSPRSSARGRLAPSLTHARSAWPRATKDRLQAVVFKSGRRGSTLADGACGCANEDGQQMPLTESP